MSETAPYILNTVQTPAPLRTVYWSIKRGNTTKDELKSDTVLSDDLLSQRDKRVACNWTRWPSRA